MSALAEAGRLPIVLLHPLGLDASIWSEVVRRLADSGHRAIAIQQRGYGGRPLGSAQPSLEVAVEDLRSDLERLGIDQCVLVGISMGAYVALAFLRQHPEQVAGLGLLSARASADDEASRRGRLAFAESVLHDDQRPAMLQAAATALLGQPAESGHSRRFAQLLADLSECPPATLAWSQRAIAERRDEVGTLASCSVPVLVCRGEHDTLVSEDEAIQAASSVARATRAEVPGAGHLLPIEDPERVAGLIRDLVESCRRRPGDGPGSNSWGHESSTGQSFASRRIVDLHFEACRDHYRRALDEVAIPAGADVLDAGCGPGSFLPWLVEAVGATGRVTALDLAPEHVAATRQLVSDLGIDDVARVEAGDLSDLPFESESFDVVWCSNVSQYLDDATLEGVLEEFFRVLRPRGRVVVKDLDMSLVRLYPGDPHRLSDFVRLEAGTSPYARNLLRTARLRTFLSRAGFVQVHQSTTLMEHFHPLTEPAREFYGRACAALAERARAIGASGEWDRLAQWDAPSHPLDDPDAYINEALVAAVGSRPGSGTGQS